MAVLKSPFLEWLTTSVPPGKGCHQDLFTAACFLLEEEWLKEEAFQILRRAADISGRNRALFRLALLGIHLELEGWKPNAETLQQMREIITRL
jgi:hypothetical protein